MPVLFLVLGGLTVASLLDASTPGHEIVEPMAPSQLVSELKQSDDEGYEGGLTQRDRALAADLAQAALESGVEHTECGPPNPLAGQTVAGGGSDSEVKFPTKIPALAALQPFLEQGSRRQRDIALVAIGQIGAGSPVPSAYLQRFADETPWARWALTRTTCQHWTPGDVWDLWSEARVEALESNGGHLSSHEAVSYMVEQMLDIERAYPPGIFSYALGNRGLRDDLTLSLVRRLLPVLSNEDYPLSTRMEAIQFVDALGKGSGVFEAPLIEIYTSGTDRIHQAAGFALVSIESQYGATVLADIVNSEEYTHWAWAPGPDCKLPPWNDELLDALSEKAQNGVTAERMAAVSALGCLEHEASIAPINRALDASSWSLQMEAAEALSNFDDLPSEVVNALREKSESHWSSQVREVAEKALSSLSASSDASSSEKPVEESGLDRIAFNCFHRCAIEHGLPVCHGERPANGWYFLPWIGEFHVQWTNAQVNDIPVGFPIELDEMRGREGYGSNTFFRVDGGWLFSVDLWHYDGDFGFVSDDGAVQRFGPETLNAAFIVQSDFGITALAQDVFGGGNGGVLAVLERDSEGLWHYEPKLELPAEAFGYAFAPDGTLLIKDAYGAVAITDREEIVPLACGGAHEKRVTRQDPEFAR